MPKGELQRMTNQYPDFSHQSETLNVRGIEVESGFPTDSPEFGLHIILTLYIHNEDEMYDKFLLERKLALELRDALNHFLGQP